MGLNLQNMTAASNPGAVEGPALNPFSPNSAVGICDDFIPGAIRCPARGATLLPGVGSDVRYDDADRELHPLDCEKRSGSFELVRASEGRVRECGQIYLKC